MAAVKVSDQIIAAVDFSDSSAEALREALRISADRGVRLLVVHVVDSRVMDGLCERVKIDIDAMLAETEKRLNEFIGRTIGAGAQIEARVLHGHPFDELLRAVQDLGAGLLVMGSHGSGDDPLRIGVIASKCIRKAPVDVMLVRELHHGKKFRKVLACVDFSENSKRAAQRALEFAKRDGAPIEFLYVYQPLSDRAPMADYFGISAELVTDEEMMSEKLAELKEFASGLLEGSPEVRHAEHVICCPSVARGIGEHARNHGFDLLSLGTRGRTGLKVLLLGTTAEKVIHSATCSTLTVKPEDFHYDRG
jgi:nucleotide-binding universal stress UspA family protein